MIKIFKNKQTQAVYEGKSPRQFRAIQEAAERKLQMLDAAVTVEDLRSPPGNRLERLSGNRKGQHSIRINKQFRVCFVFKEDGPHDVEICDYH